MQGRRYSKEAFMEHVGLDDEDDGGCVQYTVTCKETGERFKRWGPPLFISGSAGILLLTVRGPDGRDYPVTIWGEFHERRRHACQSLGCAHCSGRYGCFAAPLLVVRSKREVRIFSESSPPVDDAAAAAADASNLSCLSSLFDGSHRTPKNVRIETVDSRDRFARGSCRSGQDPLATFVDAYEKAGRNIDVASLDRLVKMPPRKFAKLWLHKNARAVHGGTNSAHFLRSVRAIRRAVSGHNPDIPQEVEAMFQVGGTWDMPNIDAERMQRLLRRLRRVVRMDKKGGKETQYAMRQVYETISVHAFDVSAALGVMRCVETEAAAAAAGVRYRDPRPPVIHVFCGQFHTPNIAVVMMDMAKRRRSTQWNVRVEFAASVCPLDLEEDPDDESVSCFNLQTGKMLRKREGSSATLREFGELVKKFRRGCCRGEECGCCGSKSEFETASAFSSV